MCETPSSPPNRPWPRLPRGWTSSASSLAATERADGSYAFDSCLQLPPRRDGAEGRILHNLAVASVRGGDELFTLTVLCGEEDWRDREALFRQVAASFRVYGA